MKYNILLGVFIAAYILALCLIGPHVYPSLTYVYNAFSQSMDVMKLSALIVSACALIIAWNNYRRGNTAIVKMVELSTSYSTTAGVNGQQGYWKLEVRFKNLGIPLQNPAVTINGRAGGSLGVPLQQFMHGEPVEGAGTFHKGMVSSYGILSFEMDETARRMFTLLTAPDADNLCITVWSDGYLVRPFYLPKRKRRTAIRHKWNSMAWKVNHFFATVKDYRGRPIHHIRALIPTLRDWRWQFENFVEGMLRTPMGTRRPPPRRHEPQSIFR